MALSFRPLPIRRGLLAEAGGVSIHGWDDGSVGFDGGTAFGLVVEGPARLSLGDDDFVLRAGAYFVAPGAARVGGGRGLAIVAPGYRGLAQLGGPIEATGRLRYIDGCTDTLLVCPPRRGEPCLNHLHLPPGTNQSAHTHPSVRIGVIARGRGVCRTPAGDHPLSPGLGWVIPAGLEHCFVTGDEALDVLAWHPDSDFGPRDDDHPMVNRTFLVAS